MFLRMWTRKYNESSHNIIDNAFIWLLSGNTSLSVPLLSHNGTTEISRFLPTPTNPIVLGLGRFKTLPYEGVIYV